VAIDPVRIAADLDSAPEILEEAVQTVTGRCGVVDACQRPKGRHARQTRGDPGASRSDRLDGRVAGAQQRGAGAAHARRVYRHRR
jgi:hypothetical protein